jgi:hypothetical protein
MPLESWLNNSTDQINKSNIKNSLNFLLRVIFVDPHIKTRNVPKNSSVCIFYFYCTLSVFRVEK